MIFESDEAIKPKRKTQAPRSKSDWIALGVVYLEKKDSGWTQARFCKEYNIPVSTLQKALGRFKEDIKSAYEIHKVESKKKSKLVASEAEKKRNLINSFRSQLKTYSKDKNITANNKSTTWFREKIKNSIRGKTSSKFNTGSIYTYVYDAKHKDTLPYWDKFPLIIFLGTSTTKNGVTLLQGLNLHYIPPRARQEFLEELLIYATTKRKLTSNTRLKINWTMVKNMAGSKEMIKNYLPQNVKGKVVEINPQDWSNIVFLPTQQFYSKGKRYSARKVWSNINV